MIEFIKQAAEVAIPRIIKQTPSLKAKEVREDITDVSPRDIPKFMDDNKIPDTADWDGDENGYDGWYPGKIYLSWTVPTPTTLEDHLIYRRRVFTTIMFQTLYHILIANGYTRKGFSSSKLRNFKGTTTYDMVVAKEWERLEEYYLMSFKLKEDESSR
ncbi:hypothetical protein Molly5_151 [Maribacter phage Molly_5]|uniref:Uncharacterized protein n=1 Tax=Maribacter phage Molly_1 TaxID=2745685 RepID=A0A8E4UY91_9CAUD|nr:hypothetical protein M1M29_gp150 [Maribacter phage Molly_1]QQO97645.1 hypothetical protein Molly2_150 [Maribacter phage Molly_2]QQO97845.1 hypothetical protein Molly3_150 [Maribacter phage Molly_3]QQO98046.1 hypothetical protein Molly4_151 [Maribacter phage Molly_4]QQO98246.1 hypothetical protein Molly5_151 [Maribacter phage Molly_5]QQO97445.1 hypothetical protein Molly1_150 [Maribacter phage Molly_1]